MSFCVCSCGSCCPYTSPIIAQSSQIQQPHQPPVLNIYLSYVPQFSLWKLQAKQQTYIALSDGHMRDPQCCQSKLKEDPAVLTRRDGQIILESSKGQFVSYVPGRLVTSCVHQRHHNCLAVKSLLGSHIVSRTVLSIAELTNPAQWTWNRTVEAVSQVADRSFGGQPHSQAVGLVLQRERERQSRRHC